MSEDTVVLHPNKVFGKGNWKTIVVLGALLDGVVLQSDKFLSGRVVRIDEDRLETKVWRAQIGKKTEENPEQLGEVWLSLDMSMKGFIQECNNMTDIDLIHLMRVVALRGMKKGEERVSTDLLERKPRLRPMPQRKQETETDGP